MHVNLEQAEKAIAAMRKKAIELNTKMCIAVVDSGANLKAFLRMDGAWVGSIDIAIKKAKTACFFGMATGQLGKLSQPGKPLYGIEHSRDLPNASSFCGRCEEVCPMAIPLPSLMRKWRERDFERGDPPLQRLRAAGAEGGVHDAIGLRGGELER